MKHTTLDKIKAAKKRLKWIYEPWKVHVAWNEEAQTLMYGLELAEKIASGEYALVSAAWAHKAIIDDCNMKLYDIHPQPPKKD